MARRINVSLSLAAISTILIVLTSLSGSIVPDRIGVTPNAKASSVYFNLASGSLNFSVTPASVNQITTNDNWSLVPSVEGYEGKNLTATHGIDPQTILGTEFVSNQLPNTPTNVAANKGNPSAFNAGGLAEFDGGTYLAIGFQGNVQANPYMVFYLNTTGRYFIRVNYQVQDIDAGSNDAVSRVALQYRVGETGNFTNLPGGYIADATDGGVAGRITNKTVVLPLTAENQPKVQVRIMTTNAANSSGGSTPDEWTGVNNVLVSSSSAPTAASVNVAGRVTDIYGRAIYRASVTMFGTSGMSRSGLTNPFGYYHLTDVEAGSTYTFIISGKRHTFAPRAYMVLDEIADLDFVSDQ